MNGIYRDIYVSRREPLVIETTQYTNAIPLVFTVQDWDVPEASTASVYVEKPSGALIFNAATISGNTITVNLTTQMTAELGVNKGQILIVKGDAVLHTFVFYLRVWESIVDSSAIESQNEFTALEEALAAVVDVVTHSELEGIGAANKGVYFDASGVANAMAYSLNADVPANQIIKVTTQAFSSLSKTFTASGMTANHVLVSALLSNPSAQTSDWTVTTAANAFSIDGSISGGTTLTAVFAVPTTNLSNLS